MYRLWIRYRAAGRFFHKPCATNIVEIVIVVSHVLQNFKFQTVRCNWIIYWTVGVVVVFKVQYNKFCADSLFLTEWKDPVGWELNARGGKGSKFVDLGQSMDPIKYVFSPSCSFTSCCLTFFLRD